MDNIRIGSRVHVNATRRIGLVVEANRDGTFNIKMDDGWGFDTAPPERLTLVPSPTEPLNATIRTLPDGRSERYVLGAGWLAL
jgi:hypothetical protein